jgi:hypothetical protein
MHAAESGRFEDARRILGLLAEPARLRVVAAVALGYTTTDDIARIAGLNRKEVRRALARLAAGGLVLQEHGVCRIDVEGVRAAARRAAEADPEEAIDASPASARVLRSFFKGGRLSGIPATRSKRLVVLDYLAQSFEPGRRYRESEVNSTLAAFHSDVAALRRYLVDEGFLTRQRGIYWRVGGSFPID